MKITILPVVKKIILIELNCFSKVNRCGLQNRKFVAGPSISAANWREAS